MENHSLPSHINMHGGYRDFLKEASVNAKKDFLKVF
jgi:hypothetical protein